MLSVEMRIGRAQRLLRMLEEDAPLLAIRVADLTAERQQSAKRYAAQLIAQTRQELELLCSERALWIAQDSAPHNSIPQPAD